MHLLVLGATGPSGLAFLKEALHADHNLTIYARNPSKLPRNIANNPNVQIIQGTFDDVAAVRRSLRTGATVLVSFAGPKLPDRGTVSPSPKTPQPQHPLQQQMMMMMLMMNAKPVSEFYEKTLFPMIQNDTETSLKRCLCCSTPSFRWREDRRSLKWWFLVLGVKLLGGSAYDEVNGIGRVVSRLSDGMEWTVFR
ncbi:Hypothetical predicted protein [Lecanosticta acicola]|uniref:NAD(P)-binding domain-containing protein n=1 Tax=Lecanosticta acicola TaxID=111012 RepID=A0AAI8YSG6_9PEZI|nr:Hypothetical predicted protein [Lecanosticta acicola]